MNSIVYRQGFSQLQRIVRIDVVPSCSIQVRIDYSLILYNALSKSSRFHLQNFYTVCTYTSFYPMRFKSLSNIFLSFNGIHTYINIFQQCVNNDFSSSRIVFLRNSENSKEQNYLCSNVSFVEKNHGYKELLERSICFQDQKTSRGEGKRDIIDCGEQRTIFFVCVATEERVQSKTRESEFPLLTRFAYLQHREKRSAYRLQCYSYKGDTLGEHMHAWPQDLTRAEGGGVIGYIDNKTNRSHLVSIGAIRRWRATMTLLNFEPVSLIEIVRSSRFVD